MHFAYALIIGALVVPVLLMDWRLQIRPYQKWQPLKSAYVLSVLPFLLWDILAVRAGHWSFANRYTIGWHLFGLPLEEILLLLVMPYVGLSVFLMLQQYSKRKGKIQPLVVLTLLGLVTLAAGIAMLFQRSHTYAYIVSLATLLTVLALVWQRSLIARQPFWLFQVTILIGTLLLSSIMTGLPIITYNDVVITNWRLGNIPIENFFYNFALLNLFVLTYQFLLNPPKKSR